MKQFLALLLVAAMIATGAACSNAPDDNNAGETTSESTEAAETEPTRANTPDNLPSDLNFDGETVNIIYFGTDTCHFYDAVGESSGDIVYDAVYMRNLKATDRLNCEINWIRGKDDWGTYPAQIQTAILANVTDYDIVFMENSRCFAQQLEGYWVDLLGADYIDYDQPWWYTDLMDEAAIDTNKRFFVTGDFAMSTLFGASAVYFNKTLYGDTFGDINDLYQLVIDGEWTHTKLIEYCEGIYSDVNGDSTADEDDIYGFRFTQWGVPNYLSMSTGLTYSTRDEDGDPVMDLISEEAVQWADILYKLLYTDNISIECKNVGMDTAFSNQKSLFYIGMLSNANTLRNVEFNYGIIPHPKLNENLDYLCAAGTVNGEGAAIPVCASEDKFELSCALLEALCSESYRTVVPTWYDTALKVKYIEAEIDADMIDLIYDHIGTSFIMMADKAIGIGSIFTNAIYGSKSEGTYASYYAKNEVSMQMKWDDMIAKYKNLQA